MTEPHMTECPICRRRPCAVAGCPRLARDHGPNCWHHTDTAAMAQAAEAMAHRRRRRRRSVQRTVAWRTNPSGERGTDD